MRRFLIPYRHFWSLNLIKRCAAHSFNRNAYRLLTRRLEKLAGERYVTKI